MVPGCEKDLLVAEAGISGEKSPWSHGSLREQGWGGKVWGRAPVSIIPGEQGVGKYCKTIIVPYCIADCVSWVPRLT